MYLYTMCVPLMTVVCQSEFVCLYLKVNMAIFFFKVITIPTQKGEHSCKYTYRDLYTLQVLTHTCTRCFLPLHLHAVLALH